MTEDSNNGKFRGMTEARLDYIEASLQRIEKRIDDRVRAEEDWQRSMSVTLERIGETMTEMRIWRSRVIGMAVGVSSVLSIMWGIVMHFLSIYMNGGGK